MLEVLSVSILKAMKELRPSETRVLDEVAHETLSVGRSGVDCTECFHRMTWQGLGETCPMLTAVAVAEVAKMSESGPTASTEKSYCEAHCRNT